MQQRIFFQFLLVSIGIALLFAGLFFDKGSATSQVISTPTPDRLAQPTLPASPSQADKGSQVYWLSCLPCHGDRGQGLTEDFIQTYPEEDRNCWNSGCHGKQPYDNGFTIPKYIPPIIGTATLQKFSTAETLRSYIFAAMPYWKPGSLTEEETWQITAFLLRENNLWHPQNELNASNANLILVGPPPATSTPQPAPVDSPSASPISFIAIGFTILIPLLVFLRILRKK